MVWFQCEDCGENLKKPKLANHFRMCFAHKLSCIDCGEIFSQQSVQSHTQCITEAEKYGPKGQGKGPHNAQSKSEKPKPNSEVDVNVGLSSRAPWFCSLCNTSATSKQALMLHADGKKHRAKARAFHAAQKQPSQVEEVASNENAITSDIPKVEPLEINGVKKGAETEIEPLKDTCAMVMIEEKMRGSKRKHKAPSDPRNGEVIQAEQSDGTQHQPKIRKCLEVEQQQLDQHCYSVGASQRKIKWKKLATSTLKSDPDGVMKIRKLQKLVIKAIQESGVTEDESLLVDTLMEKINSSSKFVVDEKRVRLAPSIEESWQKTL